MNALLKRAAAAALLSGAALAAAAQTETPAVQIAATAMQQLWKTDTAQAMPRPAKWTYDQSVVLVGIEGLWYRTGNPAYFSYMQQCMDRFVQDDGTIDTYRPEDFNIDNIACGRILLALHKVTGKEKYFRAAKTLRSQLQAQPRVAAGGFWHKKIYPNQVWLDGLYMAQPFYAEWAKTYGEDSVFNDIARQFQSIEAHTRDPKTGLMRHAWDESRKMGWADSITGQAPNVWARAMGWYGAALVDVLEYFPRDHPGRKNLIAILQRYAKAITAAQDKQSKLWWDVMNAPYPGMKGNYFEASAACQFVYTLAKGTRLGFLNPACGSTAASGYAAIVKKFVVKGEDGMMHFDGTVSVSGLGGKPFRDGSFAYYISEKVVRDDAKGVGAFLQASNEVAALKAAAGRKRKTVLLDSWFNNEHDTDPFGRQRSAHYKWEERSNGGFQFWAQMIGRAGAATRTLYTAPSTANLKGSDVYVVVDPDVPAENPDAHFMSAAAAGAIADWVKGGGTLVLLLNDSGNCDLAHIQLLTSKFGFTFNSDSRNHVEGKNFEQGALVLESANPVFPNVGKVYLKEISTIRVSDPALASPVFSEAGDVLMVTARYGKGRVFAVGDPWIYNEYVDGRKLPAGFRNFQAMQALTDWMLR